MGSEGEVTRGDAHPSIRKRKKKRGGESEVVPVGNRHGAHSRLSAVIWPGKAGTALCN